ncbi:alanine racemase [Marinomonas sp. 15G1-11]|uniref:Alanine racemase n=1 Tax=Marinomonas phaeophyticola TaxID=3004091 RepID=A0ABT4JUL4_9GAMM|nr:alanine racemase [Marinomonas sp. 15G1-11]MCZ2722079.1 alanine racemase [Marinomonas sp. 15G1-11]
MARPLKKTVSLSAIKHNYHVAKKLHPKSKAFAVVKANAYGHGAVAVAKYLDSTVDAFAVAAIEEALELRKAGVESPIMLLEGVFEAEEWSLCEQYGLWSAVENESQINAFFMANVQIEKLFVKVDIGMHRLGVDPGEAPNLVEQLNHSKRVGEVLLMSHFSCADNLSSNTTSEQLAVFNQVSSLCPEVSASVANSAAVLKWDIPEGGWIRPGIMLYGISPFDGITGEQLGLQVAMKFTSEIISLRVIQKGDKVGYAGSFEAQKEERIATIAVGYGDGYPRNAINGTPVLVNGVVCTLAGRVSMDMITVNVTHVPDITLGSRVELWGDLLPVEEVASLASTIGYELVTRMTSRPKIQYS